MIRTFQNALEREEDSFFLATGECSKTFWEAHKIFFWGEACFWGITCPGGFSLLHSVITIQRGGFFRMSIRQISLFLENKPGHLGAICKTIADAKVNLLAISIAEASGFGIVRLIAQSADQAIEALKSAGFSVNVREVTAVRVPDQAGGIAGVLGILDPEGVNIEYLYSFGTHSRGEGALLVFRFDDASKAEKLLLEAGMELADEKQLAASK